MATEKLYFIRRAKGEPWKPATRQQYAAGVVTLDGLTDCCADGAAVAEWERHSPIAIGFFGAKPSEGGAAKE